MADLTFGCCFCGNAVQEGDPESAQIVLITNWFAEQEEEWRSQVWFCHRKPCLEAAMDPTFRIFEDNEEWNGGDAEEENEGAPHS